MTTIDELHRGELARHVADLTHELIAAEQRAKDAEAKVAELERQYADQVSFDELHGEFMREIAAKLKLREKNSRLNQRIASLETEAKHWKEAHDVCCAGGQKLVDRCEVMDAEIAGLREALQEIYDLTNLQPPVAQTIARAALDKAKKP